jgi:hypothetical protein
MLITPPETVVHNRGPMDCYVCPPEVLFSCIPPHVICTWSCLPLYPKYVPLFKKTALIKASGLSANEYNIKNKFTIYIHIC